MSEYRLEMCDVVKTFPGVKALNHAQLKLKPGTVHALMGENGAGKSTLMKCMFGIYHMDEGKVIYEGQEVQIKGPLDALNRGIAMVHQELQPIPERSIGENIYVGRYPTKKYGPVTVIDHDKMYEDAAKVLKEVHLNYDPHAKLGTLSVSQMQLVEIAKAVSADSVSYTHLKGAAARRGVSANSKIPLQKPVYLPLYGGRELPALPVQQDHAAAHHRERHCSRAGSDGRFRPH